MCLCCANSPLEDEELEEYLDNNSKINAKYEKEKEKAEKIIEKRKDYYEKRNDIYCY